MNAASQLAKHFREVYTGGNWTWANLKDTLADVTWQQATAEVYSCNTIAALTYHIDYFVRAVTKVLQGHAIDSNDKYSFDVPPIQSQADWEKLVKDTFADAVVFATLVEQLPEEKLWEDFADKKYGSYFRNIQGNIEHIHYHLGQIVILKKLLQLEKS